MDESQEEHYLWSMTKGISDVLKFTADNYELRYKLYGYALKLPAFGCTLYEKYYEGQALFPKDEQRAKIHCFCSTISALIKEKTINKELNAIVQDIIVFLGLATGGAELGAIIAATFLISRFAHSQYKTLPKADWLHPCNFHRLQYEHILAEYMEREPRTPFTWIQHNFIRGLILTCALPDMVMTQVSDFIYQIPANTPYINKYNPEEILAKTLKGMTQEVQANKKPFPSYFVANTYLKNLYFKSLQVQFPHRSAEEIEMIGFALCRPLETHFTVNPDNTIAVKQPCTTTEKQVDEKQLIEDLKQLVENCFNHFSKQKSTEVLFQDGDVFANIDKKYKPKPIQYPGVFFYKNGSNLGFGVVASFNIHPILFSTILVAGVMSELYKVWNQPAIVWAKSLGGISIFDPASWVATPRLVSEKLMLELQNTQLISADNYPLRYLYHAMIHMLKTDAYKRYLPQWQQDNFVDTLKDFQTELQLLTAQVETAWSCHRYNEALLQATRAVKYNPEDPSILMMYATALDLNNQQAEAKKAAQQANALANAYCALADQKYSEYFRVVAPNKDYNSPNFDEQIKGEYRYLLSRPDHENDIKIWWQQWLFTQQLKIITAHTAKRHQYHHDRNHLAGKQALSNPQFLNYIKTKTFDSMATAEILIERGLHKDALLYYRKIPNSDREYETYRGLLWLEYVIALQENNPENIHLALDNFEKLFTKFSEFANKDVILCLVLAERDLQTGKIALAEKKFEELVLKYPKNTMVQRYYFAFLYSDPAKRQQAFTWLNYIGQQYYCDKQLLLTYHLLKSHFEDTIHFERRISLVNVATFSTLSAAAIYCARRFCGPITAGLTAVAAGTLAYEEDYIHEYRIAPRNCFPKGDYPFRTHIFSTPVILSQKPLEYEIAGGDITANNALAVTGHHENQLIVWDIKTQKVLHKFSTGNCSPINACGFIDDDIIVSVQTQNPRLRLWSVSQKKQLFSKKIEAHHLGICKSKGQIVIAGTGGKMQLWALNKQICKVLQGYQCPTTNQVNCCAISNNGDYIVASTEWSNELLIWDKNKLFRLKGHNTPIMYAHISQDSKTLVTVGVNDSQMIIWDLNSKQTRQKINLTIGKIFAPSCLDINNDGTVVVTAHEKAIHFWDLAKGETFFSMARAAGARVLRTCKLSPDCQLLLTGDDGGKVEIYDISELTL